MVKLSVHHVQLQSFALTMTRTLNLIVNLAISLLGGRKIVNHALQDTNALLKMAATTKLVVMVNMQ